MRKSIVVALALCFVSSVAYGQLNGPFTTPQDPGLNLIYTPGAAGVGTWEWMSLGATGAVTTLEIADEFGITRIGANSRLIRAAEAGLVVRVARAEWVASRA